MRPLKDDPVWVLDRYHEAKDLLDDIYQLMYWHPAEWPRDLRQRVEDFHHETFLDGCTTLGSDCACNHGEQAR